ncbi:hypothetical protein [Tunicatimonas pelagia]|uniref:hypothetical protein n=1 Tax=Tunicatimonas pelagia TaxID=931531 RepID=UPI002665882D|nr:hypothetical protein [Tunicatimonas pelagia]WKN42494.1 hypothetical protein P0M28_26005 [Tunicatimonas pelagia]
MLQLLSQSKLIVQALLIAITILVGVLSRTENEVSASTGLGEPGSALFQVQFNPCDTPQFKNVAY